MPIIPGREHVIAITPAFLELRPWFHLPELDLDPDPSVSPIFDDPPEPGQDEDEDHNHNGPYLDHNGVYVYLHYFTPFRDKGEIRRQTRFSPNKLKGKHHNRYMRRNGQIKQPGGASCNQRR